MRSISLRDVCTSASSCDVCVCVCIMALSRWATLYCTSQYLYRYIVNTFKINAQHFNIIKIIRLILRNASLKKKKLEKKKEKENHQMKILYT